jgi:O-antigen ligase
MSVYGILVIYALLYLFLRSHGIISGNVRVSFPFSRGQEATGGDAHLYSTVLSTCLFGYIFYPRLLTPRQVAKNFTVVVATLGGIVLSGSRTGLVSILLTLALWTLRQGFQAIGRSQLRVRASAVVIIVIVIAVGGVFASRGLGAATGSAADLAKRALSLNVSGGDASINSRITKTSEAFGTVLQGPLVTGFGMQSTSRVWFDNAYGAIVFSSGFLGLMLLLLCIYFFLKEQRAIVNGEFTRKAYEGLFYIFANYMLCGISSEFFLVTRGLVPFAVISAIFVHTIREGAVAGSTR